MEYQTATEFCEKLPNLVRKHTADFRHPIRCSIAHTDGSVWELRQNTWKSAFEPIHGGAKPCRLAYPFTLMLVDADGRELNFYVTCSASKENARSLSAHLA